MTKPGQSELEVAAPREYEPPRVETVLTQEQSAREVLYAGAS